MRSREGSVGIGRERRFCLEKLHLFSKKFDVKELNFANVIESQHDFKHQIIHFL